jgi:hypothetical protein
MRLGDTAIVTIDVTNISNSTVLVGPTNCNGDFELVGGSGVSYVPGDRFPCTLALVAPQPLAPGAMLRMRAFTTGRVIEPGSRTVSMPTLLSPGTYFLRSTVTAFQGDASPLSVRVTPSRITFLARK